MSIDVPITYWVIFNLFVLCLLFFDLRFIHHQPSRAPTFGESLAASLGWISIALLFNLWIYFQFGSEPATNFLAGYLMEKSLSVDNLFVFLLIFAHFRVPNQDKYLILFYGILGAIVLRALLIAGGLILVNYFSWIFYIFGLFLIYGGYKLAFHKNEEIHPEETWLFKLFRRFFPKAKPFIMVVCLVEITDLIFALDSVPAIFGITTDPFIVYTSNIFAVLGLRSLFLVLEPLIKKFYLLNYAISFLLAYIGFKMIVHDYYRISAATTLTVIVVSLSMAVVGSLLFPIEDKNEN